MQNSLQTSTQKHTFHATKSRNMKKLFLTSTLTILENPSPLKNLNVVKDLFL